MLSLVPFGSGRLGFYALLASGANVQLLGASVAAVLLAVPGLRRPSARRLSLGALSLGLLATFANAVPMVAMLLAAQSRGISLSFRDSVLGSAQDVHTPREVTLVSGPDGRQLADLYVPRANDHVSGTAIVLVHGGGWTTGGRHENDAWTAWLVERGFTVVDIDYRLAPEATWPEAVSDVQRAVEWVRAHAAELSIDPERVVLVGRSAGGHLALLAAYSSEQPPLGVVALYPPTDLARLLDESPSLREGMPPAEASPLAFVRADAPPTMLIHGTWDELVPADHSRHLANALQQRSRRVDLLLVPFARHAFDLVPESLGSQLAREALLRFLLTL